MIEVKNIEFSYRKGKKRVYTDFSVNIEPGGIYGLLGRNGTGKSTLLYIIAGLLNPQKGTCTMNGISTFERTVKTTSEIFLVPEEFTLPPISLKQYLKYNKVFYPNFSEELFYNCIEAFGLNCDLNLGTLSMGMKKKVFMSFALATGTKILLMDEPTNGLDIPSKAQFRKVLAMAMTEDRSIIISTHQVKDMEQMFDHFIIIEEDHLLVNATLDEICHTFCFNVQNATIPQEGELYSRPSVYGKETMQLNETDEDTQLNLELFFTALIENPELSKYLNHEK